MAKYKVPDEIGNISIDGKEYEKDKKGFVEIPDEHAKQAVEIGLLRHFANKENVEIEIKEVENKGKK